MFLVFFGMCQLTGLTIVVTQGNTIATDINVEGLFQKRLYEILYDNPLGDAFDLQEAMKCPQTAFENLYAFVCGESHAATHDVGGGHSKQSGRSPSRKPTKGTNGTVGAAAAATTTKKGGARGGRTGKMVQVHPIYKLQIALKLRGEADWHYKYRPQHVVHDELCMVLQKRAFRVTSNATTTTTKKQNQTKASLSPVSSQRLTRSTATAISSVQEIDLRAYIPENNNHILVHEIAFGPDADPSVRGVALWFNIDEDAVTLCTPQQAKRFRWKKSMPMAATKPAPTKLDVQSNPTISVFDSQQLDCFPMIRPHNEAAFRLVTDMLKHRLAVLKRERMTTLSDRFEHLRKLEEQKVAMRDERFVNLVRDWVAWAWPVNAGRERVDVHTPVPLVEGPYCIADPDDHKINDKEEDPAVDQENQLPNMVKGAHVHRIWNSFVEMSLEQEQGENSAKGMASATPTPAFVPRRRLAIFQDLANGKEIDTEKRALPHILKHRPTTTPSTGKNSKSKAKVVDKPSSRDHERCWKALLLLPENYPQGNTANTNNEWTIVRQHFSNSRSHKVLTILQQ